MQYGYQDVEFKIPEGKDATSVWFSLFSKMEDATLICWEEL